MVLPTAADADVDDTFAAITSCRFVADAVGLVGTDARGVGHGMCHVVLFDNTAEQVRHRADGEDGHVLTAMSLGGQGHVDRLSEPIRL